MSVLFQAISLRLVGDLSHECVVTGNRPQLLVHVLGHGLACSLAESWEKAE